MSGPEALLTNTLRPPNVRSARVIKSRTCCSTRTSHAQKAARPPTLSIWRTVSRPPDSLISDTTRYAPSRANRREIARPDPSAPAPVTITVLARTSIGSGEDTMEEGSMKFLRFLAAVGALACALAQAPKSAPSRKPQIEEVRATGCVRIAPDG